MGTFFRAGGKSDVGIKQSLFLLSFCHPGTNRNQLMASKGVEGGATMQSTTEHIRMNLTVMEALD